MTLRRIKLSAVVVVLCVLFLTPGVVRPTSQQFYYYWVGCWKATPTSICRDVFAQEGNTSTLWLCGGCGRMYSPAEHGCVPYSSSYIFNNGTWCD